MPVFDPAFCTGMLPRLAPLLAAFGAHLGRHRSPHTKASYERSLRSILKRIEEELGHSPELEDLSLKRLQAAVDAASPGAANAQMVAVRSFYRYLLHQEELELRNPSLGLMRPYRRAAPPPRLLTAEEALGIVEAPLARGEGVQHVRDALILLLLYGTGLRAAEVSHLDVVRARLDAPVRGYCTLSVVRKGNRWGQVVGGPSVRAGLARYLDRRGELLVNPEEPALLLQGPQGHGTAGGRLSRHAIYRTVRRYVPAEVRCYPHLFRHALASHLLQEGANIVQVRDLMGHRDLSTTSAYSHPMGLLPAVDLHPLERARRDKG